MLQLVKKWLSRVARELALLASRKTRVPRHYRPAVIAASTHRMSFYKRMENHGVIQQGVLCLVARETSACPVRQIGGGGDSLRLHAGSKAVTRKHRVGTLTCSRRMT